MNRRAIWSRRYFSAAASAVDQKLEYCWNKVKKDDLMHYLCLPFITSEARHAAAVFWSWRLEIEHIGSKTSNAATAALRYQWWRDAVSSIFQGGPAPQQPIAESLALVRSHFKGKISTQPFLACIDEMIIDSEKVQPQTINELEKYCEATSMYIPLLQALECTNDNYLHIADHVGKSIGIMNAVWDTKALSLKGITRLPQDLCQQNEVDISGVMQQQPSEAINQSAFDLGSVAIGHLQAARSIPISYNATTSIFSPACIVDAYAHQLEKCHWNVFSSGLNYPPRVWLQIQLLQRRIKKQF